MYRSGGFLVVRTWWCVTVCVRHATPSRTRGALSNMCGAMVRGLVGSMAVRWSFTASVLAYSGRSRS
jgi:hypothetical protein